MIVEILLALLLLVILLLVLPFPIPFPLKMETGNPDIPPFRTDFEKEDLFPPS